MIKPFFTFLNLALFFFSIASCCKEKEDEAQPAALGQITVDLDASKSTVRTGEALIGNMITDAFKAYALSKEKKIDFAIINGGDIRFDAEKRSNGIYPSGFFTTGIIDEILPFGNVLVIVKVKGLELKKIFERSVALLPQSSGPFLQISKELKIEVDLSKQSQVIDETVEPAVIVTEGERVTSIKINNVEYDPMADYNLAAPNFIAEGNDGYTTFNDISFNKKEFLEDNVTNAVNEYIILNSPVTPALEGRITIR